MFEGIPSSLDTMEPGPVLAGFLASIDVNRVSGYDRILVLRAHRRMAAHYQALAYEDIAAVVDVFDDEADPIASMGAAEEAASAEVRAALRLTRRSADAEVGFALDLRRRLPKVWDALVTGVIDVPRAKVLVEGTWHLPMATARAVIDDIIDEAPGLTTGQLRARLRRACLEANPEEAADRYQTAVEQRGVATQPTEAGTVNLTGYDLPPDKVSAITDRINRIARSLRRKGEDRTMDQLRADVFVDILTGTNTHGGVTGRVEIMVDLDTLARLAESPGDLDGFGPVIADVARQVADGSSQWGFTVTDPETGQPVCSGTTRRRPNGHQRRHVAARDRVCVFPGCRMPARDCDLDHRTPYVEGGPTRCDCLHPLCRHDHGVRQRHGWTYKPLPDGTYGWTTRLGHTYTSLGRPP